MLKVDFYEIGAVEDSKLLFAVIITRYRGKWVFVKHRERVTWEVPGGHREALEDIECTASRELFEETGAKKFSLLPVCIYSVDRDGSKSFGQLFYSEVEVFDKLPDSEIGEIKLFDEMPKSLTYPQIQPHLFKKTTEFIYYKGL